jgi:LmbE family N-acetylglucosaminyl deacetylase
MNNVQLMNDPRPTADRTLEFRRPLIFVAHPDDETLGCGGLLQRMDSSLIVFATDGAPAYHGFERKFGGLKQYSAIRFEEAARVVSQLPNCSFQRLTKQDCRHFVDQQLFRNLQPAFNSLCRIAREFAPDALFSHAYEGGHIDHDACSFIATHAAAALSLKHFEFPLYWSEPNGKGVFQQFREKGCAPLSLTLTEAEAARKEKMLTEYKSQPGLTPAFQCRTEQVRISHTDFSVPVCETYSYRDWRSQLRLGPFLQNWRNRLSSKILLEKFAGFELKPPAIDTA